MVADGSVEILLVEDNPDDLELTLTTLDSCKIMNRRHVLRDSVEALDFIFRRGQNANRDPRHQPNPVVLVTSSDEERGLGTYWLLLNRPAAIGAA